MKQKVIEILTEIRPEFEFEEGLDFIQAGMLDSLDVINLVVALDNHFGISIDGMDISPENFATVDLIVKLLKKNGVDQ